MSVVTLTELGARVRRADDPPLRRLRQSTLDEAQLYVALTYDERVAERLADLVAAARAQNRRAGAMDAIIAAAALVHGLTVWTQDGDFEVLAELEPALRIQRG